MSVPVARGEDSVRGHPGLDRGVFNLPLRRVQHAGWEEREPGSAHMYERDWLLYAARGDSIGRLLVRFTGKRGGEVLDGRSLRGVGNQGMHEPDGGTGRWRGGAPWVDCVRLFLDLYFVFSSRYILAATCVFFVLISNNRESYTDSK